MIVADEGQIIGDGFTIEILEDEKMLEVHGLENRNIEKFYKTIKCINSAIRLFLSRHPIKFFQMYNKLSQSSQIRRSHFLSGGKYEYSAVF
jgi:hypothetical protein